MEPLDKIQKMEVREFHPGQETGKHGWYRRVIWKNSVQLESTPHNGGAAVGWILGR